MRVVVLALLWRWWNWWRKTLRMRERRSWWMSLSISRLGRISARADVFPATWITPHAATALQFPVLRIPHSVMLMLLYGVYEHSITNLINETHMRVAGYIIDVSWCMSNMYDTLLNGFNIYKPFDLNILSIFRDWVTGRHGSNLLIVLDIRNTELLCSWIRDKMILQLWYFKL